MDMSLVGADALTDAFDDIADSFSASNGYVVGSNIKYAIRQEYGTYAQSGTPHVRPSIDATKREMGRIAVNADDLDDFLRQTALTLEGEIKTRAPVDTGTLKASYETTKR